MASSTPRTAPKPTASELEILGVLWEHGPATVRDVHSILNQRRETGYTTVLKLMQIMAVKGLVHREESARAHLYEAALPRVDTQKQLLVDLMEKAFGGSPAMLVQQALSARKASPKELAEIRRILDGYERNKR